MVYIDIYGLIWEMFIPSRSDNETLKPPTSICLHKIHIILVSMSENSSVARMSL